MGGVKHNGEVVMYKKQLVFQKLVCLLAIIAAAITFVYALGIVTDIYDSMYTTMRDPSDPTNTKVPGSVIYYDMQPFNATFVTMSIGLILLACLLFLTNTQVRRRYYIGNYVAVSLFSIATLAVTIWSHLQISAFKVQFLTTVDFEALKSYADKWGTLYTESTFWFDLHYFVGGLAALSVVLLIANVIWKITMMRSEKALLAAGEEAGA